VRPESVSRLLNSYPSSNCSVFRGTNSGAALSVGRSVRMETFDTVLTSR
jgi:hypothetical protein